MACLLLDSWTINVEGKKLTDLTVEFVVLTVVQIIHVRQRVGIINIHVKLSLAMNINNTNPLPNIHNFTSINHTQKVAHVKQFN